MFKAIEALNHIGIDVFDGEKYKSYVRVMDEVVSKWNHLNFNEKCDLANELLEY